MSRNRIIDRVLLDYQKCYYIKQGISKGETVFKVIESRNYCTLRYKETCKMIEINKETVHHTFTNLDDAEYALNVFAEQFIAKVKANG